jgi:hypothetical protein
MSELQSEEVETSEKPRRRRGRSVFGPVLLIAIGIFFLLANLNMLPALNWQAALRLWPLLLVFFGLNILVRQVPSPAGTLLSALVAIAAVALFGYVLLFADQIPIVDRLGGIALGAATREEISFPADDVDSASVALHMAAPHAEVRALEDSNDLIAGSVTHRGELLFDTAVSDGHAAIDLDTTGSNTLFSWVDPTGWFDSASAEGWEIGLHPQAPMTLLLDLSSGSATMDLESLNLAELTVKGGSGAATVSLPNGEFDTIYDVGSGSVSLELPEDGRQHITVDGGSGSLRILVPASIEVRLMISDAGSGRLSVNDARFALVEEEEDGAGSWETGGFPDSSERVELVIDVGSGSVTVAGQ